MKQVILRHGMAVVEEVPDPFVEAGTVLVAVDHSCISIGTEMSGLRSGGMPLWKRALRQRANVQKAVRTAMTIGPKRTWSLVRGQLAAGTATGYSAAGTVVDVGMGVEDVDVGDRVACAGAQFAHHAEVIRVPRNLMVPIPDAVSFRDAATVTLGAIAMQGIRRAAPTLGETFVVIGLGVLGQLAVQLLKANGCRVIGTDLDAARIALAVRDGMDLGVAPAEEFPEQQVARLTDGSGADGVIITAATPSDSVMSLAFKMCRRKGRVVLVGDVGLSLQRADFYQKELDFFISTSYGPGRYDRNYEEKGLDYPVAYVRWTENRNMAEYLRLLGSGHVRLSGMIDAIYPLGDAERAYASLKSGDRPPVMVLLSYPGRKDAPPVRRVQVTTVPNSVKRRIGVALVGAGGFAKGMHLPNLRSLDDVFSLQAVVSRTGHNAVATARQYGARYASTDFEEILRDDAIDAVIIATRHNLHARMTLAALAAGKHVLVEKPTCVSPAELQELTQWFEQAEHAGRATPVLLTGFNRRFSRYGDFARRAVRGRSAPMIFNYRMNAGHIPLDHWVHGAEGGGRNIGEACHIYDLMTSIIGGRCTGAHAMPIRVRNGAYSARDNFVATMGFEDGSVATLTYTALGHRGYSKEQLEIFVDGKVVQMDDYKSIRIAGVRGMTLTTPISEKGQKEELRAWGQAIQDGGPWPIALWEQVQAMEMAFSVDRDLTERS